MAQNIIFESLVTNRTETVIPLSRTLLAPKGRGLVRFTAEKVLRQALIAEQQKKIKIENPVPSELLLKIGWVVEEEQEVAYVQAPQTILETEKVEVIQITEPASTLQEDLQKAEEPTSIVLTEEQIETMTKNEILDFLKENSVELDVNSRTSSQKVKEAVRIHFGYQVTE